MRSGKTIAALSGSTVWSFALLLCASQPASAQISPLMPGLTVNGPVGVVAAHQAVGERPQPDYAPIGQPLGAFLLFPTLDVSPFYNSNVYATENLPGTPVKGDFGVNVTPGIALASNWSSNALNFVIDGQIRRYLEQVSNNESNFSAAVNGRLDVLTNVYLTGALGYALQHEDRTSPSTVTAQAFPTEYQLVSARLGFVHEVGVLGFRVDTGADVYQYNNNTIENGLPFNCTTPTATSCVLETDRNRVELGITPRLTYEIQPGYSAFVQAPINARIYQSEEAAAFVGIPSITQPVDQDSHGYEVDVGSQFAIDPVIDGELYVGYQEQDYDASPVFVSPHGIAFGGNVLWNPTLLDSARVTLSRTIEETTLRPASSYVQSSVALDLEHELLRQVLLTAGGSFADQDYQGITRDDHLYTGTIGARYLVNRAVTSNLNVNYQTRLSNVSPNSYHQVVVMLDVHFQY